MAQKLSQLYDVDNRYREAKGVADNVAGKQFLQESKQFEIIASRKHEV